MSRIALAMLAFLATSVASRADDSSLNLLFKCNVDQPVCIVKDNPGGIPLFFYEAADEVQQHHIRVVVDGNCISACVIFASAVQANVCVTKNAHMKVHKVAVGTVYDAEGKKVEGEHQIRALLGQPRPGDRIEFTYEMPDYGAAINQWMMRGNKVPDNPDEFYTMTYDEMLQFWNPCS